MSGQSLEERILSVCPVSGGRKVGSRLRRGGIGLLICLFRDLRDCRRGGAVEHDARLERDQRSG